MPLLTITNNGLTASGIHATPTLFKGPLPPSTTSQFNVTAQTLMLLEGQLGELKSRVDSGGNAVFDISITQDRYAPFLQAQAATADVTRWAANRVAVGVSIGNPTIASTVSLRRFDIDTAGELYVDGEFFAVPAADNTAATAHLDLTGAALAGDLGTGEDRSAALVAVNNANALEYVLIYSEAAAAGLSVAPTEAQIAAAVGEYLGEPAPVFSFVMLASILFEEAAGLTQTTTNVRQVPPSY